MSLMLKTRKGNTVPFGYKLAEDNHSLEPIENELAALEKAKEYVTEQVQGLTTGQYPEKTNLSSTNPHIGNL